MDFLAEKYFLSLKSIQRIIGQLKKEYNWQKRAGAILKYISPFLMFIYKKSIRFGPVLYNDTIYLKET